MSLKHISKISRNSLVKDVVEASLNAVDVAKLDFEKLEATVLCLADENTIDSWEKWFNLDKTGWGIEDRRQRLIYTFNSRGFFTPQFLKQQANIFSKGEIDIEEQYENYHFIVQFTNYVGIPDNVDSFKQMIEINKPAHLTFEIRARFRTHRELKKYTHEYMKKYTHNELRELRNMDRKGVDKIG
ncbi:MAG: putative phage tail protein [Cetobacterium sp.]|uniref:putative phage tail protein n=1 Tax=Cetobacterium sp. TaxID=2071632 RepID=UPI003F301EAD